MTYPESRTGSAPPTASTRTILVADDDASTREFLAAALGRLGYAPTLAVDGRDALEKARRDAFDALLLDCRMPGAGAEAVLSDLRADDRAASRLAAAFATSAEVTPDTRRRLLAAGFVGVIEKPCRVDVLGLALASLGRSSSDASVLDDAQALAATGDIRTMHALRALLRDELRELDADLATFLDRPDALVERLHRLRSACGFCGAGRLAGEVKTWQRHLEAGGTTEGAARRRFQSALRATLAALQDAAP